VNPDRIVSPIASYNTWNRFADQGKVRERLPEKRLLSLIVRLSQIPKVLCGIDGMFSQPSLIDSKI